jgi:preprotein translocase subunit SecE
MQRQISVRTSRIVFAVLAFVIIITMIIALAPGIAGAPS